jgi:predicted PurR-regulated permease PerM
MLKFDIKDRNHIYQLIAGITAVVFILLGCLLILSPFFPAILLAIILALSTWPAFEWLNRKLKRRTWLSASLMTILLALCFIVPLVIIGTSSADNFGKISGMFQSALQGNTEVVGRQLATIPYAGDTISTYWIELTADQERFEKTMEEYVGKTSDGLIQLGGSIGRGLLDLTLGIMIAFFFFRHGTRAAARMRTLIDKFGGEYGQRLLEVSKNTLIGVVYGIMGTALAQGALAALGFWLAGVPGASFLGLMTFFLSFIPNGPPFIWVPAAFWLYTEGHTMQAVFLGFWGLIAVSGIDNVLRPYFISLHGNLPFLLTLLGIIGGIIAFGFIGIFIGPTLLALAYALIIDWTSLRRAEEKSAPETEET